MFFKGRQYSPNSTIYTPQCPACNKIKKFLCIQSCRKNSIHHQEKYKSKCNDPTIKLADNDFKATVKQVEGFKQK